jgi:hypothetical protein
MRFALALVPAFLLLASTGYYMIRPRLQAVPVEARLESSPAAIEDRMADDADAELVRNALNSQSLSDVEAAAMVGAAGRRYLRRKLAYSTALAAGKSSPAALESLRKEVEQARHVCDVTESWGRHNDPAALQADFDLEMRLAMLPSGMGGLAERHDGRLAFSEDDLKQLGKEFQATFGRPLPVSAHGESAVHRAMGFDHRGRTDVAVNPDTPEGAWLRHYLTGKGVSFYAFRSAVAGKATGAHIHIGPASGKRAPGA